MKSRFKRTFEDEDGDESGGDSDASPSSGNDRGKQQKEGEHNDVQSKSSKRHRNGPRLEDLQEMGFRSGPSVLAVKEKPPELSYEWGNSGVMQSQGEDSDEDFEERELTRAAANHGTEKAILLAAENKRKLAEDLEKERYEHSQRQQQRRESYQQKEKRKRELGQAKKQKNYVEEEKRLLRQHNVYSGFDN